MKNKETKGKDFLKAGLPVLPAQVGQVGGFTLIELLVTISIFIIITSVVLAKNSGFNSSIQLSNLAYEVAVSLRQAQVYGISVRGVGGNFDAAYGVHFHQDNKDSYVFFRDANNDGDYDGGEEIEIFSLRGGVTIYKFCATGNDNSQKCNHSSAQSVNSLDITFKRPYPNALIKAGSESDKIRATITLQSFNGENTREVEVYDTGQISVVNPQ